MGDKNILFEPITIGRMRLKNKVVMAPMGTLMGTHDGYATDQLIAFYNARAKGGVGLIILEHTLVTDKYGMNLIGLWDDWHVTSLNELVESVHAFDTKIIVQLSCGLGRQRVHKWHGESPVAPSPIPYVATEESLPGNMKRKGGLKGEVPRELTVEEIIELEDLFAEAAGRARYARFDGVEIHGANGYLIFEFLSPLSNRRTDIYGGSIENRIRFASNIIKKTRKRVGKDFVVGFRFGMDEHVIGGLSIEESKEIAPVLINDGLDYIHVSSGTAESWNWLVPEETGKMLPDATKIKGVSSVPVICPNIHDPQEAEDAIRRGAIDLVSLGRPLLADPEWPNKVMNGKAKSIRRCQRENNCLKRVMSGMKVKCICNAEVGYERNNPDYYPPKRIVKYW